MHDPGRNAEDGFSLIELVVVVGVIGILVALAVPTLFGARERTGDRQAQTVAKLAHRAEQVHATGGHGQTFTTSPASLEAAESSLDYTPVPAVPDPDAPDPTAAAQPTTAYVQATPDEGVACVSGVSPTGTVFTIMDAGELGTFYREGTGLPECDGEPSEDEGWLTRW